MFGDYLWVDVTDRDISNEQLLLVKPSFYVRLSSDYLFVSDGLEFTNFERYKMYLPEWMKFVEDLKRPASYSQYLKTKK